MRSVAFGATWAADVIADLCDLASQIFVKATQHRQFRDFVVGKFHRAKRMRHAAGGLGNDVRSRASADVKTD
jgi:hypothetical protein